MDPSRMSALLNMSSPATGADLQQFLCAANWMRRAIPGFNKLTAVLANALEDVYAEAGKRTRKEAAKVILAGGIWKDMQQKSFVALKVATHAVVTLEHPDPSKTMCLFTDASDLHWAGVLTQIPSADNDLLFEEQNHAPLPFLSVLFTESSSRWSTAENEAFAIVESISQLDYMLLRPERILLFTDHKNLTYIFNPVACNSQIKKHVANKIERWALRLTAFRYDVVHISGEDSVWADLLSRWGSPSQQKHMCGTCPPYIAPSCP